MAKKIKGKEMKQFGTSVDKTTTLKNMFVNWHLYITAYSCSISGLNNINELTGLAWGYY